jgi:transposase
VFIREVKKSVHTEEQRYDYIRHRLIESVRTPNGPRQKVILDLGELTVDSSKFKTLANMIEGFISKHPQQALFDQDPELGALARHFAEIIIRKKSQVEQQKYEEEGATTLPTFDEDQQTCERYETVDVNSSTTCEGKSVGAEHIALTQLKQLSFFNALKQCGFSQRQQHIVAAQVCARMVHPASERETARWLRENSALDELLGEDFSKISDQTLHKTADALWKVKDRLETSLANATQELFGLKETLVLYDLTNTFFESPKRTSNIARRGRSKEKRSDCPLVTLALVVDGQGFAKRSQIFEGNVSEPATLWKILQKLGEGHKGQGPQTVVIDAGIATEDNLQKLREDERFEYVAISRDRKVEKQLFEQAPTQQLTLSNEKTLTVKMAKVGQEVYLLCHSPDRALKDGAIINQRRQRFEKALVALRDGLSKPGTHKSYPSTCERVGRLKERYKVGPLYTVQVEQKDGQATGIEFLFHKAKVADPGQYLIRTSRNDLGEKELSLIHRTLTMIESAFRWLKSDLGMRPNFHQNDYRIESHIFISVLAYFVLAPILNKLDWGGQYVGYSEQLKTAPRTNWNIPYGWHSVINTLQTQVRITTSLRCKDGHRLDIRTTMDPTESQRGIYQRLKMKSRPLSRAIFEYGAASSSQETQKCSAQKSEPKKAITAK